jgi:hypothetical protein
MPFHTVRGPPQRTVSGDEDGTGLSRAARDEESCRALAPVFHEALYSDRY